MGDWGFRISKKGVDAETGADKDMALTTKYPLMKGAASGSGLVNVYHGVQSVVTIPHGLGYIPMVQAYTDASAMGWAEMPSGGRWFDPVETFNCYCYADATNVYLVFDFDSGYGSGYMPFNYKYFIYKDKGKL